MPVTLTYSAQNKAVHYGITTEEVEAVVRDPEIDRPGNRPATFILSRRLGGRTVVVVTNWERDVAITTYVPDDEWQQPADTRAQLRTTRHAADRMRLMNLTLPEVERIVAEPDWTDNGREGTLRFHKFYERRDIIVVTDPARTVVISVFPKDSVWAQTGGAPDIVITEPDALEEAHDVITSLTERVRALEGELAQTRNEAAMLRDQVEDYEAWLATVPRRAPQAA
jgi:hypothetical protein